MGCVGVKEEFQGQRSSPVGPVSPSEETSLSIPQDEDGTPTTSSDPVVGSPTTSETRHLCAVHVSACAMTGSRRSSRTATPCPSSQDGMVRRLAFRSFVASKHPRQIESPHIHIVDEVCQVIHWKLLPRRRWQWMCRMSYALNRFIIPPQDCTMQSWRILPETTHTGC